MNPYRYDLPNFGHLCYSLSIMMDLIAFGEMVVRCYASFFLSSGREAVRFR